jgi:sacsin
MPTRQMRQVNPITARLRDILRNYSSAQLLNEMLQNADDAGSTEFKVLLDGRTSAHGTRSLLSPALAHAQGPALYQFDDAEFNPEDYESIQRVGDGTKMGDPTKTGQFGLGFNSVYHVTDTPMFISGSDFVVFDPHETHLPEGMPGLAESARELAQRCPDQLAPFTGVFDCDPLNGWQTKGRKGTLFRLPLRTREAAARSKIKDGKGGAPSFDDVMSGIIEPFLYERSNSSEDGSCWCDDWALPRPSVWYIFALGRLRSERTSW